LQIFNRYQGHRCQAFSDRSRRPVTTPTSCRNGVGSLIDRFCHHQLQMAAHFMGCRPTEALVTRPLADISMDARRLEFIERPTGLIPSLQRLFERAQIFGDASAFAKYCQP
jgi:hypothetical protein